MARLPFNPDRVPLRRAKGDAAAAAGSPSSQAPRETEPLSVSQVAAQVRAALAQGFPRKVRVVGEISNFSQRSHWFFSLKDDGAALRCVCFASAARKVGFPLADGMEVIATGRVDYYDAQGSLQLYVDKIEPVGQGALELKLRALMEELRLAGYFDPLRKKPLPAMPQRVAVVTSRSGAALQDVINTAYRRWPGCELLLLDVRVQGAGAAQEIARAIDLLSRCGGELAIDAIILTRGGGSMEDLWAFNERVVAQAIFRCQLPLVAAIGHETDTTIAELVADARCATPTQAAMTLIPDRRTLQQQVSQLASRLNLLARREWEQARRRLEASLRRPTLRQPQRMLGDWQERLARMERQLSSALPRQLQPANQRLGALSQRLLAAAPQRLALRQAQVTALARQLEALGPRNVLARGFSYTLGPDGRVLRDAAAVNPGDALTSVLHQGQINSRVVNDAAPPAPPRTRRRIAPDSQQTPSLFSEPDA